MKYDMYVLLKPAEYVRLYWLRAVLASLLQNIALWIIPHQMLIRFEADNGNVTVFNFESSRATFIEKSYCAFNQEFKGNDD